MQVHKVTIDKVANSLPGRGNIELEIYGMEGIPEQDMIEHEKQKQSKGGVPQAPPGAYGDSDSDNESGPSKQPSTSGATAAGAPTAMPVVGSAYGMPPRPPPPMPGPMGMPMMPPFMGMPPMGMMAPMMPMAPMMGPMRPMPPPPPGMEGAYPPGSATGPSAPLPPRPPMPAVPPGPPAAAVPMPPDPSLATLPGQQWPVRPLFPAAVAMQAQAGVRPPQPTTTSTESTPASQAAVMSAPPSSGTPPVVLVPSAGASMKLIHPAEDISLEEKRAQMPRYRRQPAAVSSGSAPSTVNNTVQHPVVTGSGPMMGMPAPAMPYYNMPRVPVGGGGVPMPMSGVMPFGGGRY